MPGARSLLFGFRVSDESAPTFRYSFIALILDASVVGLSPRRLAAPSAPEIRRESMLRDLKQRIRDVRQGPDGFLYLLTDEDAILKIEPAP